MFLSAVRWGALAAVPISVVLMGSQASTGSSAAAGELQLLATAVGFPAQWNTLSGAGLVSEVTVEQSANAGSPQEAAGRQTSPVLGTHPKLGAFAAPMLRFRDGGHAYYLFGKGLHSCTYVGKCMDLFAAIGEPVYAMADGDVEIPDYASGSYGHHVIIKHDDGTESISAHLDKITVKSGRVLAGTQIGTVGCSGTSGESNRCRYSAAHLHMEWSGLHWNPGDYGETMPYFDQWRGNPARCYRGCGP